jgi:hypothetical protein
MKQFLSLMLASVAGCAIALSGSGSGAQETLKADSAAAVAIQGSCVVMADGVGVTLVNPSVRVLGDRQFLVGPQPRNEDEAKRDYTKDRYHGAVMWIPLDSITEIGQL